MNGRQPSEIAWLKSINLDGLRKNSLEEKKKLFSVAKEDGIFYLDLGQCDQGLCGELTRLNELNRSLFSLPYDEKIRFDIDAIGQLKLNGYKPIGRNVGGNDGTERDDFETYAIPRNGIFSLTTDPFLRPSIIDEYMETLKKFTLSCMGMAHIIFSTLSEALSLPSERSFESFHSSSFSSPDIVRLLRYAPSPAGNGSRVPHTPHTDLGSLTFLFAESPGLQILPDGSDSWLDVMPKPGHIIINFGDAMSILSGGVFQSILHRVASMPGRPMEERYSLAFLMRPENSTPMCPVPSPLVNANTTIGGDDEVLTSEDWIKTKFGVLRGNLDSADDRAVLAGGRTLMTI